MDTFALRQIKANIASTPLASTASENFPSVTAYRAYASDPRNEGTFVSTSGKTVTTAPKTFYGHTVAFIIGKTNSQEATTLHQSLKQHFGPHVANYSFPPLEREQAAVSPLGGYLQQTVNVALTTVLNPTLRNIKLTASLPENSEQPSPALPFYQRQLRPILQAAVQEVNPMLKGINVDASLATEIPPVGISHRLVQQVIKRADDLVADTAYITESSLATVAIVDVLQHLNEVPTIEELKKSQEIISGLAADLATHHPSASIIDQELLMLLKKTTADVPKTVSHAHQVFSQTKALASLLKALKEKHDYYEMGSSSPIKLESYNFEQFREPATLLFQEVTILAANIITHLCNPPSSSQKVPVLDAALKQNARINRDLATYAKEISQLKEKLKTDLKALRSKADTRKKYAEGAISSPSLVTSLRETLLIGHSWEEERALAQEDLDFATAMLNSIEAIESKIEPPVIQQHILLPSAGVSSPVALAEAHWIEEEK